MPSRRSVSIFLCVRSSGSLSLLLITSSAQCNYPLRSLVAPAKKRRRFLFSLPYPSPPPPLPSRPPDASANRERRGRSPRVNNGPLRSVICMTIGSTRIVERRHQRDGSAPPSFSKQKAFPSRAYARTHRSIRAFTDSPPRNPRQFPRSRRDTVDRLCHTYGNLHGIPSCSRPGKLRALIKFSLGTLTELGPSFIKRRIKVIFP